MGHDFSADLFEQEQDNQSTKTPASNSIDIKSHSLYASVSDIPGHLQMSGPRCDPSTTEEVFITLSTDLLGEVPIRRRRRPRPKSARGVSLLPPLPGDTHNDRMDEFNTSHCVTPCCV
ncbi:hypothetical protein BASA83_009745 [Batrachochytrium salamandrivorans]|nr:hypothetical protein BASA83_009745 [Batrachochytrium salamandrivorans]